MAKTLTITVDEDVVEELQREATSTGRTLDEVASDRLEARPFTGLADRIRSRLQGNFLEPHERIQNCNDDDDQCVIFT